MRASCTCTGTMPWVRRASAPCTLHRHYAGVRRASAHAQWPPHTGHHCQPRQLAALTDAPAPRETNERKCLFPRTFLWPGRGEGAGRAVSCSELSNCLHGVGERQLLHLLRTTSPPARPGTPASNAHSGFCQLTQLARSKSP